MKVLLEKDRKIEEKLNELFALVFSVPVVGEFT